MVTCQIICDLIVTYQTHISASKLEILPPSARRVPRDFARGCGGRRGPRRLLPGTATLRLGGDKRHQASHSRGSVLWLASMCLQRETVWLPGNALAPWVFREMRGAGGGKSLCPALPSKRVCRRFGIRPNAKFSGGADWRGNRFLYRTRLCGRPTAKTP